MSGLNRRTFLAITAVASVVETSSAESQGTEPQLQTLIASHETAYAALLEVVHRAGSTWHDRMIADRIEQQALLAVCFHPATGSGDRRAKAEYLLEIEARGELDLEEHMRALLHSLQS